jgi:serine phosphatase RsbU (regulator of sigma subunit)
MEAALLASSAVVLLPAGIVVLGWLLRIYDAPTFAANAVPFSLLILGSLVTRNQSFTIPLRIGPENQSNIIGSMTSVIHWAGLLAFGRVAIWLVFLDASVDAVLNAINRKRRRQEAFWSPLVTYLQGLSASVLSMLIAATIYELLGGEFPFAGHSAGEWAAALVAIAIYAILPSVFLLPLLLLMGNVTSTPPTGRHALGFVANITALSLALNPFATLGALLYASDGVLPLAVFVLAATLTNLLAHYLSHARQRAQDRARELAHLEALGEALLGAPSDCSTLETVLKHGVRPMFPNDLVEIQVDPGLIGLKAVPPISLPVHEQTVMRPDQWASARASSSEHKLLQEIVPPGMPQMPGAALVVAIVPHEDTGVTLGHIALFRTMAGGTPLDSLPAIQSLASQISAALFRAKAYGEALALQRTRQELAIAGRIQASFLPRSSPVLAGWDLAATLVPARETSGDFYDFVPLPEGRLAIIVADVADKGTGAALYMALSRTLIRTYATQYPMAPGAALRAANDRILADTLSDQFVTVFYGIVSAQDGTLVYANAGHNPALLFRRNGDDVVLLKNTGIPLGMFEGMNWEDRRVELAPGDALVMYSDGVTEAQNETGEEFGERRLIESVASLVDQPATSIQAGLLQATETFVADSPQFDDITVLVACRA